MSSGLVATMGLPAQASAQAGQAAPATAPIAVQPAVALASGLMSAAGSAQSASAEVTAPAAATVSFGNSAFTAIAPRRASHAGSSSAAVTGGSFGSARGSSIVAIAARYIGVPYVYGGTSPGSGWDCSGATGYIYAQAGEHIPRTANQQMLASRRISRSEAVPGDLVFFLSGGHAYHTGVYAGGNMMYDAGRSGSRFSKRAIFSSAVVFGRF